MVGNVGLWLAKIFVWRGKTWLKRKATWNAFAIHSKSRRGKNLLVHEFFFYRAQALHDYCWFSLPCCEQQTHFRSSLLSLRKIAIFRKCVCCSQARFSHDVTKIQTTKLSILQRFYFHDVLEQLKTNFHTNFRFKSALGFVIEYAWILSFCVMRHFRAFTWRPRERLSCRFKKWLISRNFTI